MTDMKDLMLAASKYTGLTAVAVTALRDLPVEDKDLISAIIINASENLPHAIHTARRLPIDAALWYDKANRLRDAGDRLAALSAECIAEYMKIQKSKYIDESGRLFAELVETAIEDVEGCKRC